MTTCTLCDEDGYMIANNDKPANLSKPQIKLDRRSESYRKAIKDIMNTNSSLTRQEAVKLFDEAYAKGE